MSSVSISSSHYIPADNETLTPGFWDIVASYEDETGTRCGPYRLSLPETATQDDLSAAITTSYVS